MDGTGVPVVKNETNGRKGKSEDGTAKTREAKLVCVFTQRRLTKYDEFKKQGLFIGLGVVEAGCRAFIGQRLKQSCMRWTVNHGNNIIALRSCMMSNRWEDYWENRACA